MTPLQAPGEGLHILNVSHSYDSTKVLTGVSVFVGEGEVVCLLGPSGCGKTTLLRIAAGLEQVQVGRITIGDDLVADGSSPTQWPPEKRGVGLMFQDYALFPHLTVFDNIAFGIEGKREVEKRRAWIMSGLNRMGLEAYAEAYPHVLSGGQQQRVALLRALAPNPRVLLLDEPFSGLDVTRRAQIREETFDVLRDAGVAALMVTHDPEEAMFMADRILVMNEGRVVQSGSPTDIYFQPNSNFVAELFGPVNRFTGTVHDGSVETLLGRFPAPTLHDGDPAEVLIRPEALSLAPSSATNGHQGPSFRVVNARTLGRSSHLALAANDMRTDSLITARVPDVFLPPEGSLVNVGVAPERAHVFSAAAHAEAD